MRRPVTRRRRLLPYRLHRSEVLLCLAFAVLGGLLMLGAHGLPDFWRNLMLNLSPEVLGAMLTIVIIQPLRSQIEEGKVQEHPSLHYPRFCDRIGESVGSVAILDTFSYLFTGPSSGRFAQAARRALGRGTRIRVLLLDPDSPAAEQRSSEIRDDVQQGVRKDLEALELLRGSLPPGQRDRLEVRLYSQAPSIQMYRWDERMFVSFFPVDRLSGGEQQLEVRVSSPLGSFVQDRFRELWLNARPALESD